MSKKERYLRRTIFFAIIAVIVMLLCGSLCRSREQAETVYYNVRAGDTLWSIAIEHKPEGMDTRKYIDLMYRDNDGLTPQIQAGQAIQILVWED